MIGNSSHWICNIIMQYYSRKPWVQEYVTEIKEKIIIQGNLKRFFKIFSKKSLRRR